jgi:hypothetical protein
MPKKPPPIIPEGHNRQGQAEFAKVLIFAKKRSKKTYRQSINTFMLKVFDLLYNTANNSVAAKKGGPMT